MKPFLFCAGLALAAGVLDAQSLVAIGASTRVPADAVTEGAVTFRSGQTIPYRAIAGTLLVGSSASQDAVLNSGTDTQEPAARMFYTAYLSKGADPGARPIVFLYNGGPGAATMYLHMASVGPVRALLEGSEHPTGGPPRVLPNPESLLDVADLVFIDAPGTGYSRLIGKDAARAFYGVDQDAEAFSRFIRRFLTQYERWTSPRFLFGESYGTTRTAVLSAHLHRSGVDLNGVILLSQLLNFNDMTDSVNTDWGTENGAFLSIPCYATAAWYHHKVKTQTADFDAWRREVEEFSLGEYATALVRGDDLRSEERDAIASKLETYTGIAREVWIKSHLRMSPTQFARLLEGVSGMQLGRYDSRVEQPAAQWLDGGVNVDPSLSAVQTSILSAMNSYARQVLKYGDDSTYRPSASGPDFRWDATHADAYGRSFPWIVSNLNVSADLAYTMTENPKMQVLVMGGYFDLVTSYFGAAYEMKHLPIEISLRNNISFHFFAAGHMVYVDDAARREMHEITAAFIRKAIR